MHINLKNKNILVTGASRGIGKAIATTLIECGAKVAVHYNHNKNRAIKVSEELGAKAVLFQSDFSDAMQVSSLFNAVIQKFKRIDVLINNAGIALNSDPDADDVVWIDQWLKTMDVNLNAAGLLCKKAVQHFKQNQGGIIINIASRAAFRGDTGEYLAYAASKGGMVALTRSIARAYGKDNIKAFIVAPGFVKTDMAQGFLKEYGENHLNKNVALPRLTEPADIAPLVAFLASGMADHATGGTFDMNAGSYVH